MIYVSSNCIKKDRIDDIVELLSLKGLRCIEMSAGNDFDNLEKRLPELKSKYDLNILCHNYFPPSKQPFVLNLASLNDDIYQKTIEHLKISIKLSKKISAKRFGFHAGFFLDVKWNELGRDLICREVFDKDKCVKRFCEGFNILKRFAGDLELYVENNVLSAENLKTFKGVNPVMLTNFQDYEELRKSIDFKLLLDVGHLKVSCHSLGLNFNNEFEKLIKITDYLHISDNDGLSDLHLGIKKDSDLYRVLKLVDFSGKIMTLEINEGLPSIIESQNLLKELI